MKFSTRDLCFCAIGAALIAVCAWISIPADVPFTLQTFAIFAVCGLLGGKRGTVSVLVYLLLGAVGAPVFAGFRGGFASLIGTTGGYIVASSCWRSSSPSRRRAGGSGSGCSCCRLPWGCSCATHSHGVVSHRLHPHGRDHARRGAGKVRAAVSAAGRDQARPGDAAARAAVPAHPRISGGKPFAGLQTPLSKRNLF